MARKQVSHPEEVDLIRRLRVGDQEAQSTLVRRYQVALFHQAFLVLRNEALAEDAVQDGWLAAFRSVARFEGRSSLLTWLAQIVVNAARSQRLRESRTLPFSALVRRSAWRGTMAGEQLEHPKMGVTEITPERCLLAQEAIRTFEDALRALPEIHRSVVVLRDLEGASSADACRVLMISDGTQRVRLSRARATLRLVLQQDDCLVA